MIKAGVGSSNNPESLEAAERACRDCLTQAGINKADFILIFITFHHRNNYQKILEKVSEITQTHNITGCSATGVLSHFGEIEDEPGIVVLCVCSDNLKAKCFLDSISTDMGQASGNDIKTRLADINTKTKLAMVLADPFSFHHQLFFGSLEQVTEPVHIIGATCSENPSSPVTFQYNDKMVNSSSLSQTIMSGNFNYNIGLTQGCKPASKPLKITDCNRNVIMEIDGRPAYEVLRDYVPEHILENPNDLLRIVSVGLCSVSNCDTDSKRNYMVRNLMGVDDKTGIIGIAENINIGDEIVITLRNPEMARDDLKDMLENLKSQINDLSKLRFGIYFNCCGRGAHFYGNKNIDTAYISNYFPDIPIIGFFGNSEIAPMMGKNHLFTYTGVLTLFSEP
ncbi:MAG: hypothetical protein GWN11_11115 [Candidatus Dadabacteria bacterium]|nr:hypothetical protein [Candidatus Dadabacteria bacterium]